MKTLLLRLGVNFLWLSLSVFLYTLSFPNALFIHGLFPLAFLAFIPLFLVVQRSRWLFLPFYGIFYGYFSYFVMNNWLGNFHPYALVIVPIIYAVYFLLFLPILKICIQFFPRRGFLLQALAWVVFEYLCTCGFLGYSYGNVGYTQYLFLPLIRIANVTGVWGVSLLVVFPSALLAWCLTGGLAAFKARWRLQQKVVLAYGLILLGVLLYGVLGRVPLTGVQTKRMALVQQNVDPWRGGYKAYRQSLDISLKLSRKALAENPELIVWSETSFIPSVDYHIRYRENPEAFELVDELLTFLAGQQIPYVIGNDHGEKRQLGTTFEHRVDYNAALLFNAGQVTNIYRKIHLVPFVEHFPYQKQLPRLYQLLIEADTHFWEKGSEYTVFEAAGVRFSTPICFEDTFGSLCAAFVRRGADVLVNLTNDSWSFSEVAEVQHMVLAVFRAVENSRSLVRSTNGGITCGIDPNGKIIARLEPFREDYLIVDLPIYSRAPTLYTRWGDWFPFFLFFVLAAGFSWGVIRHFKKKRIDKV